MASIVFREGGLRISAMFTCVSMPFRRKQVLVGTGTRGYTLLFGESLGRECNSSDVSLQVTGETPFADLNLAGDQVTALRSSDAFWTYTTVHNTRY